MNDPSHPLHQQHPSHPDNHPTRPHHPTHHKLHKLAAGFILLVLTIATLTGVVTNAPFGSVLLSFFPAILLGLLVLGLASSDVLETNYLLLAYVLVLVFAAVILPLLIQGAEIFSIVAINAVLGAVFILFFEKQVVSQAPTGAVAEVSSQQRELASIFSDIIERAKRINTAIGRAYSVYQQATSAMREKIKIQSSVYNQLDPDKKEDTLKTVLLELQTRLSLLKKTEQQVFSQAELNRLDRDTSKRVIDVLARAEGEGVLQAHSAAVSFVDESLKRIR